jgi:hypothetical protein
MKKLMVSCEEATRLISQSLDGELSSGDRFALRLRLLVCSVTRRAKEQMELVNNAITSAMTIEEKRLQDQCVCLSEDKKQSIQALLSQERES